MSYTLGTAAKATGKSRTSILRAIEKGKISAKKDDHGRWNIDPSELHRVYPPEQKSNSTNNSAAVTVANSDLLLEITTLKAKLEAANERDRLKNEVIEDLRQERDDWKQQATALLTDQREKSSQRNVERFRERLGRWIAGKS